MVKTAQRSSVHPVTIKQHFMLERDVHPDCRDDTRINWVLAGATLVRPRVDMRRLKRAVEKLRERHENLRIRFEPVGDTWQAVIDPPGPVEIEEIDLGDIDDATFQRRITEIANQLMPLVGQPLAQMILVKCGVRGDVIVSRVHHALADAYGMIVLTEDLFKYLIGMPILSRALSHADYLARFQSPPAGKAAAFRAFWEEMHRDFPPAPEIGRKAKGLAPNLMNLGEVEGRMLTVDLTGKSATRLVNRARDMGVGSATALFSGFLEGLCRTYDTDRLMFTTHIGRTHPALASYCGDCTLDPVVRYRAAGAAGFEAATGRLGADLLAAIDHLPCDMARRGTPYSKSLIEAGGYPEQFSCHQPRPVGRQDRSVFAEGLNKAHGEESRVGPYVLSSIDVSLPRKANFELQFRERADRGRPVGFSLGYDGMGYSEAEIRGLADTICSLLGLEPGKVTAR